MRWWNAAVVVSVLALALPALAEGMKVDPGKWEFRSTSKTPMGPAPVPETTTECITESEMDPDEFLDEAKGCSVVEKDVASDKMTYVMSCDGPTGPMTGRAVFRSTGSTVKGGMKMQVDFNGQPMTFETTWEGKRVGDCE